jgi:hypothetical protein
MGCLDSKLRTTLSTSHDHVLWAATPHRLVYVDFPHRRSFLNVRSGHFLPVEFVKGLTGLETIAQNDPADIYSASGKAHK